MNNHAVYGGSFDPTTLGHIWIIKQALNLFDKITVVIANNQNKQYMLPLQMRFELLQELMVSHKDRIEIVILHNQFLATYAHKLGAQYLIRGIRNHSDYEYEKNMHYVNLDICPQINTVFLIPPKDLSGVSSTVVKQLFGIDSWHDIIKKYIPDTTIHTLDSFHNS